MIRFGLTPYNWVTAGESPLKNMSELFDQVRLARKLNFDSVVFAQHFLSSPYQMPQSIPLLSRISAESGDMRLATGVLLLSLLNPVEVAEQISTLDIISGGRAIFGVGLGYRDVEYNSFGVKKADGVPRLRESLSLIKELWTKDKVDFHGKYFNVEDATMTLKPVQKPHPPVWMAGDSDRAVLRAAALGDCWYANPHVSYDTLERQVRLYREELSRLGRPFPQEFPIHRELYIAKTSEEAYKLAAPFLGEKYSVYHQWGQDQVVPKGEEFDRPFDELAHDRFIIGSPSDCIEQLSRLNKRLGFNHFIFRVQWPGMEQSATMNTINLLGESVLSYFRASGDR